MTTSKDLPHWSTSQYWQQRFVAADTPWQLDHASSVLVEAIGELERQGVSLEGTVGLSPGCGRGLDALELARRGCSVVAVDWSATAVSDLTQRYESARHEFQGALTVLHGDFFSIAPQPVDFVFEHTFFCAIDPSMRGAYVERLATWIRPGGLLVGDFFIVGEEVLGTLPGLSLTSSGEGPPFAVSQSQLLGLVAPFFTCHSLHPGLHPEPDRRPGLEWVGIFQRR